MYEVISKYYPDYDKRAKVIALRAKYWMESTALTMA